jgi:mevalonate kinase
MNNKKIIIVSAPGKLMLFGEHAVVYGKPCLVTAVDQRLYLSIQKTDTDDIRISAEDVGIKNFRLSLNKLGRVKYPGGLRFVLTSIEEFLRKYKVRAGLKLIIKNSFSKSFGFGSSSAVTVCTARALAKVFDIKVSNKMLFDMCYKTVLRIQKVGSGFDLAAAIWGGTLYFVKGGKVINRVVRGKLPLVVGYSGVKADTVTLVNKVNLLRKRNPQIIDSIFNSIEKVVGHARVSLVGKRYKHLGELANINQGFLESLGVNTRILSNLLFAARQAGAYGAKLSGAGGGDCMIAFVDATSRRRVEIAIKKAGGTVLRVKTGAEGVRLE